MYQSKHYLQNLFLNLNKNTKRNIELREIEEEGKMLLCDEDSRISEVEEDKDGKESNNIIINSYNCIKLSFSSLLNNIEDNSESLFN